MINVFAVFTGKILKTPQKSSFDKRCLLKAKTNVLHNFGNCNFNFFYNSVMLNVLAVFTGKLLETLQNKSFHERCFLEAKTFFFAQFCNGTVILTFS